MYKYETHLHTSPVSVCARVEVRETLEFYKSLGYDGVFITNHFFGSAMGMDDTHSYEERINFYFSDYEKALNLSVEIGIKVFCGLEISYGGTDFLVYGLNKEWLLSHPEIMDIEMSEKLQCFIENGALIIHAHPFKESLGIDHIRLYPRCIHGVEIVNANRSEFENKMAELYAEKYGLIKFAGSDNHFASEQKHLAGVCSNEPVLSEQDFIEKIKNNKMKIFSYER